MEVTVSSIVLSLALVTFLTLAWKALNWVWLRPKQIERCLRDQGFKGNAYRFLYGDTKEIISAIKEARSKPLEASDDDIVPRVLSFHRYSVNIHGPNYFTWLGPTPRLNIADPKLIKEILANYEVFQKPAMIKSVLTGILALEGEKWAKHRKLINPAFQLEKLKLMVPAMYRSCSEMISKWEVLVSTEGFCEVDVWPYLSKLTADVISRTAFGSNYEEGKLIFQLLKEQTDSMQRLQLISIPGWRFLPTKTNKKKKQIHDELGALLHNIINKRRGTMNGEDGGSDLLGTLLTSNLKDIDQEQLGNKKSVTEEVIEECKLFYLAGQETTSNLLVWTMVLLSKNQKWQTLAREEILAVCGDNRPDFDTLKHLKTILHEALRLYPPGPAFTRVTHKKTKLGGLVLPAGVEIFVPIMEVHRDPKIWGEDSKYFKLERFSEGVSRATKGQGTFFPFSGGPRVCIGQNFALVEAKIALTMILKHFSFQLSPSYVHAPSLALTKGQGTFFPLSGGPRVCIGQNFALVEAKIALAMILKHFSFQLSPSYVHAPSLTLLTVQPEHGVHLILQKIF